MAAGIFEEGGVRVGTVTLPTSLVASYKWSWTCNLHWVLWTFSMSIGIHTFSAHRYFFPHTQILLCRTVKICHEVNKIWFYLKSTWLCLPFDFCFPYLEIHTFHMRLTTTCYWKTLVAPHRTRQWCVCMYCCRVTGSSMQDLDLVWKFSHQHGQPPPAEHNTNAAVHLLEELGHIQLS